MPSPLSTPVRGALVVLALGLTTITAVAHQKRVSRQGMVTVRAAGDAVEIDALVVMRVAGERAVSFFRRYDLNRDGALNEGEGRLLADSVSPDVLGGLVLRKGKGTLRPHSAQGRARRADRDALEIAILVSWRSELQAGDTFEVAEKIGPMGPPSTALQIQASALAPLQLGSKTSPVSGGVVGPAVLKPDGAGLAFTVVSTGPAPPRPHKAD